MQLFNTRSGPHNMGLGFCFIVSSSKVKTNGVISSHWWETADEPQQHPGHSVALCSNEQ